MLDFNIIQLTPSKEPGEYGTKASTLLISCIDFRLRTAVESFMKKIGLMDDYDEVVFPGASIAVAGEKYPRWAAAGEEIILVAKNLHDIKNIIILDHKDCGAFRIAYGQDKMSDPHQEEHCHMEQMQKAKALIHSKFPDLNIYLYIMGIDGKVENWTHKL